MQTTIPADLRELKARLDQWRATRKHIRQPLPTELRQAVLKICQRHPYGLVRRILKIDPWRLKRQTTKNSLPTASPKKGPAAFFSLPTQAVFPGPGVLSAADYRLQLDHPDGTRLTLTMPALDLISTRQICEDFLRRGKQ
jgi:hypothetical protein